MRNVIWLNFLEISFLFQTRGKWACFGQQDSLGKLIFLKMLRGISIICRVFTPAQWADSSHYTAAKLGRAFWCGASFSAFWKADVLFMCYRSVLYLFNCKLLLRLASVVLLGCCEFNPNVTCARREVSDSAKWGCFGLLWLTGKNGGRDIE